MAREAREICEAAMGAGRPLSLEESQRVDELLDGAREYTEVDRRLKEIGYALGPANGEHTATGGPGWGGDPGGRFVASEGFKTLFGESGRRPQSWSTGLVPVTDAPPSMEFKGTLAETSAAGWGGGAGLVSTPQVIPGIVPKLQQGMVVEGCLGSGISTTSSVRYIAEGTATSGAAGVAEATLKPESSLGFTTTDESIKKIATLLPVSEEMLSDAPAISQWINSRLVLFVQLEAERQLIRGTSGGAEVQGLLTSRSVPIYNAGTAAGNKAVQLFRAMSQLRGSALIEPDFVWLHPDDYMDMRLLQDSNSQFYGGGPFAGSYGNGGQTSAGVVSGATDSIWGIPAYITASTGKGTAVIGNRAAATVWSRGGVSVEATNSHSTYFALNLVAVRAERRLAVSLYRPTGFIEVRLA